MNDFQLERFLDEYDEEYGIYNLKANNLYEMPHRNNYTPMEYEHESIDDTSEG